VPRDLCWYQAIAEEIRALEENQTWTVEDLPSEETNQLQVGLLSEVQV